MASDIRVLHVDDDPQFSELTVEFLESIDNRFEIDTITDPVTAVDVVSAEHVDCVVSDYDMPEMNGIEFLEAVRDRYDELPFILFTGKGSEEVASDAISAGVTDYLQKSPGTDQFHLLANRITNAVEQTRATAAAEETERRLRELAESMTDALWMFSGDWDELLFVNSVVSDLLGVSPPELYHDPHRFRNHIHPRHRDQVERAMEQVTAGYPIELEYRLAPETGSSRWVWVSGEPILDDAGEVVRIVGFTRDITDRKRRERERREAARRLDVVLDSVQVCIWMRDDDRRFLLANEQFHGTFGLESSVDVVGCLLEDLVDEETATSLSALDDEVLATQEPLERECTLPTADGEGTYLVRITPLFDETGATTATCGIAADITDRKRRLERLHGQSERLAALSGVVVGDLMPAIAQNDGSPTTAGTEAVVNAVSAMASERTLDREPVSLDEAVRDAWRSVAKTDGDVNLVEPPTVEADRALFDQLLRTVFRGVVDANQSGPVVTVGQLDHGFFVESPAIDPDPFADGSRPAETLPMDGWERYAPVIAWIVSRHGWSVTVETNADTPRLVFENLEIVEG